MSGKRKADVVDAAVETKPQVTIVRSVACAFSHGVLRLETQGICL
jgi:hypothetical protein